MLESEPSGLNFTLVVEDDVEGVLFSTDTVLLAALTLNLDLSEEFHLLIERQFRCDYRSALIRPHTDADEVVEWADPGVDGSDDGVTQCGQFGINQLHLFQILGVRIVDVIENNISWRPSIAIVEEGIEVVKQGRSTHE